MSKFCIWTFGCRCNQADSAAIRESLCQSMSESGTHLDADLIVVNTCTVTHRADQQARQAVRRLHRDNPTARIVVTGCYAQRDPASLASVEGVSLVLGNPEKERLAEFALRREHSQESVQCSPVELADECPVSPMMRTGGKTRPIVKIQDGCDMRCSYCIVPFVRGPGRSARPGDVLAEIRSLIAGGFQEIVLTGVHLSSFERDGCRLVDLLRRIVELPGLGRVRLSSIEPMRFDRAIVDLAAESPAFAPHFHIPMQSGCDRVLRRMKRPYTAARYRDLLQCIREKIPDAGLGADVLTGFPGETDRDFAETCELVEDSPLTYLHVFPFSPREGTDAYSIPGRIPASEMKRRLNALLEISRKKNFAFRRHFTGRTLSAITLSKEEDLGNSTVLTGNYIQARIPGPAVPPNRLVEIRIEDVQPGKTRASLGPVNE